MGTATATIHIRSLGVPPRVYKPRRPGPLDMFRTMVNVLSDSCGAVIVAKLDGEEVLTPS